MKSGLDLLLGWVASFVVLSSMGTVLVRGEQRIDDRDVAW